MSHSGTASSNTSASLAHLSAGQGWRFDLSTDAGRVGGMDTMTPDGKWCSVEEAVGIAGCTDGLIRLRLREGRLEGFKANERAWMVSVEGCRALRGELAPHSNARKAEAAKASTAKPKRNRRKTR